MPLGLLAGAGMAALALVATNVWVGGSEEFPVPSAFTGLNDPQLQQCVEAHGVCDPAAESVRRANNPEANPPGDSPVYETREVIELGARRGAKTPLTPEAAATSPTYSALMSRQKFEAISGENRNAAVDSRRAVWVVTVHAPMATDGSPGVPPEVKPVYSVAFDAETGQWTDACIGCAWLDHSE